MAARRTDDLDELIGRTRRGEIAALARLISLVEVESPRLRTVAEALRGTPARAYVVGITGSPGVGKSTLTSAVVGLLRAQGQRVAVLAVDPSSPVSGGALLGDRVRMHEHGRDPDVFIRSMASRGSLGGLAAAVPQALRVLDAAGFDVVLVETVGVGQAEVDIAALADTTLVVLAPGLGDGIQAAKAGVLEIADVFVVNKADLAGAAEVARDLGRVGELAPSGRGPAVISTVAARGEGVADLVAAIETHRRHSVASGQDRARRLRRAAAEIEAIALADVRRRIEQVHSAAGLAVAAVRVAAGDLDPYAAADLVLDALD